MNRTRRLRLPVLVTVALGTLAAGCTPSTPTGTTALATPAPTRPGSPAASPATPSQPSTPSAPVSTPPGEQPGLAVTVMTYNTLTGRNDCAGCRALKAAGRGDELALDERMPVVAAKVELADPDIIGFQENEGPRPLPQTHLARLLEDYSWAEPAATVPIAYRSDRFRLVDSGTEVLERERLSCRSGDRTDGRFVSWARLAVAGTDRQLWVFNTHLHPYDTVACAKLRARNLDRLREVVEAKNPGAAVPPLVLGDFNAFGDERRATFRRHRDVMAGLGMDDSRRVADQDVSDVPGAASAHWMTAPVAGRNRLGVIRRGGRYIDFVWVPKGTDVRSWQVLSGPGVTQRRIAGESVPAWSGVMASDHSPVVVTLVLPAAG